MDPFASPTNPRPAKALVAVNLIAALVVMLPTARLAIDYLGSSSDKGELLGYLVLLAIVGVPSALLLGLAALTHWLRSRWRWAFQGLAVAMPIVLTVLLLV